MIGTDDSVGAMSSFEEHDEEHNALQLCSGIF